MNIKDRLLPVALLAARLLAGGIFLVAGLDKVLAPGGFADAIRAFHLLPPGLVLPVAFVLPWLELLVGVYLLAGYLIRLAAGGAIVLLLSFVVALASSLLSGDTNHACGCFGSGTDVNPVLAFLAGGPTITWWDLIRDLLLIALAGLVLIRGAGPVSIDAFFARRRQEPHVTPNRMAERRGM